MQDDDWFPRLSWVYIRDGKMLFVRKRGTEFYFDPGCRPVEGEDPLVTLANKIGEDFGVQLILDDPAMFSFRAPAHGKGEETMVEIRCYHLDCVGVIIPAPHLEPVAWFSAADAKKTSDAGKAILAFVEKEGLMPAPLPMKPRRNKK